MATNTTNAPLPTIVPGAEPFLLAGGDVGCVCVHGFGAAPEQMRWLGESLHARGLTVYAPRLAGHGTQVELMGRQHWLDWYEDVIDGVALLRGRCRKVFVAGLSMGGVLALRAAAENQIDGALVLASPMRLNIPLRRLLPVAKTVWRYYPLTSQGLDGRVRALQRDMGRREVGTAAYRERWPVAAIAQLDALVEDTRRHLSAVRVPLLLVYSHGDRTVPFGNMAIVAQGVSSQDVVQRTLDHSDHILTQEDERETVYAMVWDFLSERME